MQDTPCNLSIYSPEVVVIVATSCAEDDRANIEDDIFLVDWLRPMVLTTVHSNAGPNLKTGEYLPAERKFTYDKTLTRQLAQRDNHAVKQLRLFMQSVQNDDISTVDTIIELPKQTDVTPLSGDTLTDVCTSHTYKVIAVDDCTFSTRIRIGARRFS